MTNILNLLNSYNVDYHNLQIYAGNYRSNIIYFLSEITLKV